MNTIATNLRFPAVSLYKSKKLTSSVQINLAEKFRKSAIRINISVLDLISDGRKFDFYT